MAQVKHKFASFADYLAWSDDPANFLEGRFERVDADHHHQSAAPRMAVEVLSPGKKN